MIEWIHIKVYYKRVLQQGQNVLCHIQNVISVTDKTDKEKWLDAEIWFIFLFQYGGFWQSPLRLQCLGH